MLNKTQVKKKRGGWGRDSEPIKKIFYENFCSAYSRHILAESHLSSFSGPGNSSRKFLGFFPNIIPDHLEAENPLCPWPPGTAVACLLVRGTEHPHGEHVGKMVSVLEDIRSGRGNRAGPCERVRHTNITKINPRSVENPSANVTMDSRSTSSQRGTGRS